jgi:hypothetical protein
MDGAQRVCASAGLASFAATARNSSLAMAFCELRRQNRS